MSFEVHITRGGDPLENIDPEPITLEEWRAVLATEADVIEIPGGPAGQARWQRGPDDEVTFDFHNSHISVTDPDEATLEKAAELARALQAELHGEDGEEYDAQGHLAFDPGDEEDLASQLETQSRLLDELAAEANEEDLKAIKRSWWKRALRAAGKKRD